MRRFLKFRYDQEKWEAKKKWWNSFTIYAMAVHCMCCLRAYYQCQNAAMQSNYSRTYFKIFVIISSPCHFLSLSRATFLARSFASVFLLFLWRLDGEPPSNRLLFWTLSLSRRRFLDYYYFSAWATMKVHTRRYKRIKQPTQKCNNTGQQSEWKRVKVKWTTIGDECKETFVIALHVQRALLLLSLPFFAFLFSLSLLFFMFRSSSSVTPLYTLAAAAF